MSPHLWSENLERNDILRAIERFDLIGRARFNAETGSSARSYFIHHRGQYYDCKSLLIGAYMLRHGKRAIGGFHNHAMESDVRPLVEALGFKLTIDCGMTQAVQI